MAAKAALITGGIRGIGRAIALKLAAGSWSIASCYRSSGQDAASLESEVTKLGAECLCLRADVSVPEQAEKLVRDVEARFGGIDALINCAGPYHRIHILEESVEGWNEMFDNNLHPVFYLSRAVAAGMKKKGWGRIVNFSMANADQGVGQPFVTAHYIAKVGILVLTRSLAKALAPHGITVNAVSPGFIETGSAPLDELDNAVKNIPAGFVGSPEDAVGAVCFLLSEESRYVNGTNIHLSGGWGI
jgi:3-oxoacyl-[acyl-carrier protein] reductase